MRVTRTGAAAAVLTLAIVAGACASDSSDDPALAPSEAELVDSETDLAGPGLPNDGAAAVSNEPEPSDPYGIPWSSRALQNHGIREEQIAFRFAAQRTGTMVSVRPYIAINKSRDGYAAGNGGQLQVQIVADDGTGAPDMDQVLATSTTPAVYGLEGGSLPGRTVELAREVEFQAMTLDQPVPIIEGERYHAVFSNVDPDPFTNWVSVQGLWDDTSIPAATRPSFQDWGILRREGGDWEDQTLDRPFDRFPNNIQTPILSIVMDDGVAFGNGYMEVWVSATRPVTGSQRVRQTMTPDRDVLFREIIKG